ncbi:MAG: hypothetical protein JWN02_2583 [Acidobacteria bacterium]|nr:hypothetical protein [Acidobacteriota bacterium]
MRFAHIAVAILFLAAPLTAAPVIVVDATGVTVSGITAHAQVAMFAVWVETPKWQTERGRAAELITDTAGSGTIRWTRHVPAHSLWVAVDMSSGAVAVSPAVINTYRPAPFPADGLKRDANGQVTQLALRNGTLELLVVRPGEGAWWGSFHQGGSLDADGIDDGQLALDPRRLQGVPTVSAPAPLFQTGDVVILVDPDTSAFYTLTVGN